MAYSIVNRQYSVKYEVSIQKFIVTSVAKPSVEIVDINLTQAHFRPRRTPLVNCLVDDICCSAAAVRSCHFRSATSICDMTGPVWDPGQPSQHRRRTGPVWVVRGLSRDGLWSGLTLGSTRVPSRLRLTHQYPVSRVTLIRAG